MTKKSKMSKRFKPTLQQRIEATRFVAYELWMLRECADMPRPETRVAKNLWYEGLVLHTRVLRDFFFTKHNDDGKRVTHDRDIVAVDYFTLTTSSWPYTSHDLPPYLKQNKDRMDCALAHLSFGRLDYIGQDKDWSPVRLRDEIGAKWFEFLTKLQTLKEPAAAWFLEQAQRLKDPLVAPF